MEGKIILLRHGRTKLNAGSDRSTERIRGWTDVPLDDEGKRQCVELARVYKDRHIDAIISTPLSRGTELAKAISAATGVRIIETRGLLPWNLGDWGGKEVLPLIDKMKWFTVHQRKVVPGGESFRSFRIRFLQLLSRVQTRAYETGRTILAVTHLRNTQCAKAWLANGRPLDLSIDVDVMNDYTKEIEPGEELVITAMPPPKRLIKKPSISRLWT
jgi:broad specificity phosphatase PhoE